MKKVETERKFVYFTIKNRTKVICCTSIFNLKLIFFQETKPDVNELNRQMSVVYQTNDKQDSPPDNIATSTGKLMKMSFIKMLQYVKIIIIIIICQACNYAFLVIEFFFIYQLYQFSCNCFRKPKL